MRLHPSESSFLFADYTNEHGETIYRVRTHSRLWPRTTTISKRIPPSMISGRSRPSSTGGLATGADYFEGDVKYGKSETDVRFYDSDEMKDRFAHLCRIDFREIGPSKLVIAGQEFESSELFRKVGLGLAYGRDRVFTGPDGKEYKWVSGWKSSKLILNDGSKTEVANFHIKAFSFTHKRENTYLEIMPNGEHMADMIFITFLYVEKKRREKQGDAASSSFAGVVGS